MAETTEKTEQDKTISHIIQTIDQQYKTLGTLWEMIGQIIDYIMVSGDERKDQNIRLIRELYESKLAERHNTQQLQMHRGNTEVHFSDKKGRNYLYE